MCLILHEGETACAWIENNITHISSRQYSSFLFGSFYRDTKTNQSLGTPGVFVFFTFLHLCREGKLNTLTTRFMALGQSRAGFKAFQNDMPSEIAQT